MASERVAVDACSWVSQAPSVDCERLLECTRCKKDVGRMKKCGEVALKTADHCAGSVAEGEWVGAHFQALLYIML